MIYTLDCSFHSTHNVDHHGFILTFLLKLHFPTNAKICEFIFIAPWNSLFTLYYKNHKMIYKDITDNRPLNKNELSLGNQCIPLLSYMWIFCTFRATKPPEYNHSGSNVSNWINLVQSKIMTKNYHIEVDDLHKLCNKWNKYIKKYHSTAHI